MLILNLIVWKKIRSLRSVESIWGFSDELLMRMQQLRLSLLLRYKIIHLRMLVVCRRLHLLEIYREAILHILLRGSLENVLLYKRRGWDLCKRIFYTLMLISTFILSRFECFVLLLSFNLFILFTLIFFECYTITY